MPPGRVPRDFIVLSRQILQLANQGATRLAFLREVSRRLLAFTRCEHLEIWLTDGPLYYRWTSDSDGRSSFKAAASEAPGFSTLLREMDEPIQNLLVNVLHGRLSDLGPNVTDDGAWWTSDASNLQKSRTADTPSSQAGKVAPRGSLALMRIEVDAQTHGLLMLAAQDRNFFSPETIEAYEAIAQTLGMAVASRRAQAALKERVKEFSCLYGIAHILEHRELSLSECLRRIVQLLPGAWQFPEMAAARIVLDGQTYSAGDADHFLHRQQAPIVVGGVPRGSVDVGYIAEREEFAEGPFLREEESLILVIAREISHFVERMEVGAQQAQLEEQLRHADRLATIGQFAAGIAHELNEPLGGILGFAQLASKSTGASQQVAADLDHIVNAALRAREIVRKLMIFARQSPPSKAPIKLNQIVDEAIEFLGRRGARQPVELIRDLDPELPEIFADPLQIHQVAVNLIVNALQALPGKGVITVRTKYADDASHSQRESVTAHGIKLIVEDNGSGIEPDILPRIFNPFFTTKDVGEGTGLGLSVVHGIVTSHGGTIDVFSKPGHGSRFEVTLPINSCEVSQEVAR